MAQPPSPHATRAKTRSAAALIQPEPSAPSSALTSLPSAKPPLPATKTKAKMKAAQEPPASLTRIFGNPGIAFSPSELDLSGEEDSPMQEVCPNCILHQ